MFGKAGLGNLMKQAQQMQNNMKRAQEELANIEVQGEAGAGAIKIIASCNHAVKRVIIEDNSLLDDKEMLEDLIVAAMNDTNNKIESTTKEKMGAFTNGLNLPPGMDRLFG
ncbi:MAG: YbaB/EbfC family nucleoid-associated protein [Neisseriaceae bacterium]|nr:MAG: YbaB/EbfC family nucleoid-associated protein [Neisseriaceae bacterium]